MTQNAEASHSQYPTLCPAASPSQATTALDCLCVFYDNLEYYQFSFLPHCFWWAPYFKKTAIGPEGDEFPHSNRVRHSSDDALNTATAAKEGQ